MTLGYQYHSNASATPPAGTLIQNTHRHEALSAIRPPTMGPSTPDKVKPAVIAPSHFARSAGGQSPAMMIQMLPMTPADPMPCTARTAISWGIVCMAPATADETVKRASEMMMTRLPP